MLAKLILMGVIAGSAMAGVVADVVFRNGKVYTVDAARPVAQAVAVWQGRVLVVGSNEEVAAVTGAGTKVIDLQGRLMVPGFHDSHVHLFTGGTRLAGVQLRDAKSEAEFRERVAAFAKKTPKGRWITGGDWDHENFASAALPTRQLIDGVTEGHPVFINRLDGHMALANTEALRRAGITRETKDPPGGSIVRDARGEPTGVLKDSAMDAVYRVMPEASVAEVEEGLAAAIRHANAHGVTSVTDVSSAPGHLAALQRMQEKGALTLRVYGMRPLGSWKRLAEMGVRAGLGGEMLRMGGLKGFADGSLGSTTAWLFAPYRDAQDSVGLPSEDMLPVSKMREMILGADKAGLQVAVHAIGDRANREILNLFEEAMKVNGARERRFRIEHAQHLAAEDIGRFGKLGVVASMQPYHAADDGRWAEKRIGPERAKGTYAFRSLLDQGAVLAFGSDWFVAPISPVMGIWAAVTRRTLDGKRSGGWVPEQKITVGEAIRAYTWGSAYASMEEGVKGSIASGKYADFAILDRDITIIGSEAIGEARVVMTVVGGKVVYETR